MEGIMEWKWMKERRRGLEGSIDKLSKEKLNGKH